MESELAPPSELNVFSSLFPFRPRDGHSPKENFLTEALVYALKRNPEAAREWVKLVTGGAISPQSLEIRTRQTHVDETDFSSIYPDVKVSGIDQFAHEFSVLVEHKWDSPCSIDQLKRYAKLNRSGCKNFLTFVCARLGDLRISLQFPSAEFPAFTYTTVRWQDVFRTLTALKKKDRILEEFLQFMGTEGLGPGKALTLQEMTGFIAGSGLKARLARYCEKLLNEHDWNCVPEKYRKNSPPSVRDRWGRVAIEFGEKEWNPATSVGFLYDPTDHRVQLLDPSKGIDLAVRVHANPSANPSPTNVLRVLSERAAELRKLGATVHLKDQPGNGSKHTLILIRRSVGDIISHLDNDDAQIQAIYDQFRSWCLTLFADHRILTEFATLKPY